MSDRQPRPDRERRDRPEPRERRDRLDTPRDPRRSLVRRPSYDADAFGIFAEQFARFMGTARFLLYMSAFVAIWVVWNALAPSSWEFDAYPFIFLTLMLSLQASYAAPLILLAQNRQELRDKVVAERDRRANARAHADMEFLAREVASLRMALGEVATRDFLRSELRSLRGRARGVPGRRRRRRRARRERPRGVGMAAMSLDQLLALEHAGWTSLCEGTGAAFYGEVMTEDGLMVLVDGTTLDRDQVVQSLEAAPAWDGFEISGPRLVSVGDDAASLVYRAEAARGDDRFVAVMASTYRLLAGHPRLALYQQTTATR